MRLDKEEQQLLRLISNEKEHHEIAEEMKLSMQEINEMIESIMLKFEAKTVVGLVKKAIRNGLITNE